MITRIDYDHLDWLSYGEEYSEKGCKEGIVGAVKIMQNMGHSDLEIIHQLMPVFGLSHEEAEKLVAEPV